MMDSEYNLKLRMKRLEDANTILLDQIDELKQRQFAQFNNEDCWIWQGDGDDQLHTLVCPVVISAAELQAILDNQVGAGPEEVTEEEKPNGPVFPSLTWHLS